MSVVAPRARRVPGLAEILTAVCLIAAPFVLPYLGAAPNTVNRILVWGLFGIGFDILFGYTGLLSFGQSALYGTGGFVAAYLLTRAGFPHVTTALVIGMVAAAFVGYLVGLVALEMFVTKDGRVLANEMAPRPHNSGHWTIDACATSQFEQLVRAICGVPLGAVDVSAPSRMERSFAQTTSSATRPQPAAVSKPQSVPASTRVGSPTTCATRSMRSATTSGCSTKLVSVSITPATRI